MTISSQDREAATLERVRKLLAKAEDEAVTPQEAESLTEKAAELMAKYGIQRAMLGALHPETDKVISRKIWVPNPWADVHSYLLGALVSAMRCKGIFTHEEGDASGAETGKMLHVFGYQSDIGRAEILWTSVLLQMAQALQQASWPHLRGAALRAERRSFLLGYAGMVIARVKKAEERAASEAGAASPEGPGTALVLADRSLEVKKQFSRAYPKTRKTRITYTGRSYRAGASEGSKADLGGTGVGQRARGALA